mmetsp:Transcript_131001/g.226751  ORF Transcript_131001/g.226751 Transcript_131001/m.226751 type:complete len:304 (+) Transcript_131001:586-1497(+)
MEGSTSNSPLSSSSRMNVLMRPAVLSVEKSLWRASKCPVHTRSMHVGSSWRRLKRARKQSKTSSWPTKSSGMQKFRSLKLKASVTRQRTDRSAKQSQSLGLSSSIPNSMTSLKNMQKPLNTVSMLTMLPSQVRWVRMWARSSRVWACLTTLLVACWIALDRSPAWLFGPTGLKFSTTSPAGSPSLAPFLNSTIMLKARASRVASSISGTCFSTGLVGAGSASGPFWGSPFFFLPDFVESGVVAAGGSLALLTPSTAVSGTCTIAGVGPTVVQPPAATAPPRPPPAPPWGPIAWLGIWAAGGLG